MSLLYPPDPARCRAEIVHALLAALSVYGLTLSLYFSGLAPRLWLLAFHR